MPGQALTRIVFGVLLLTFGLAANAEAGAKPKHVKYVPPDGFDGHPWGELRTSPAFAGLPEKPVGVGAAWMV